jgi:hypothetical protein
VAHSLTHPHAAEDADRRKVEQVLLAEEMRTQMRSPEGRRFVARLLDASRVFDLSLGNSVATVQSGIVAVRDFAMRNLLGPILKHCETEFFQMRREEDDRNGSGSNTN